MSSQEDLGSDMVSNGKMRDISLYLTKFKCSSQEDLTNCPTVDLSDFNPEEEFVPPDEYMDYRPMFPSSCVEMQAIAASMGRGNVPHQNVYCVCNVPQTNMYGQHVPSMDMVPPGHVHPNGYLVSGNVPSMPYVQYRPPNQMMGHMFGGQYPVQQPASMPGPYYQSPAMYVNQHPVPVPYSNDNVQDHPVPSRFDFMSRGRRIVTDSSVPSVPIPGAVPPVDFPTELREDKPSQPPALVKFAGRGRGIRRRINDQDKQVGHDPKTESNCHMSTTCDLVNSIVNSQDVPLTVNQTSDGCDAELIPDLCTAQEAVDLVTSYCESIIEPELTSDLKTAEKTVDLVISNGEASVETHFENNIDKHDINRYGCSSPPASPTKALDVIKNDLEDEMSNWAEDDDWDPSMIGQSSVENLDVPNSKDESNDADIVPKFTRPKFYTKQIWVEYPNGRLHKYNINEACKTEIIDAHCNLNAVLNRMSNSPKCHSLAQLRKKNPKELFPQNFGGCVAVFSDPSHFTKHAYERIVQDNNVWACFGVNPSHADKYKDRTREQLNGLLYNPKAVAVGAIGLDYSSECKVDRNVQKYVFKDQLRLVVKHRKPLIIHYCKSMADMLWILAHDIPDDYRIYVHGFTGNWDDALKWMDGYPNLKLGLSLSVTEAKSHNLHQVAANIPLNRLLLETDSPNHLPRLTKSKIAHPGHIIHTAAQIVAIRGNISLEDLLSQVRRNTRDFFGV